MPGQRVNVDMPLINPMKGFRIPRGLKQADLARQLQLCGEKSLTEQAISQLETWPPYDLHGRMLTIYRVLSVMGVPANGEELRKLIGFEMHALHIPGAPVSPEPFQIGPLPADWAVIPLEFVDRMIAPYLRFMKGWYGADLADPVSMSDDALADVVRVRLQITQKYLMSVSSRKMASNKC